MDCIQGYSGCKQNRKIANDAYWVKWRGLAGRAGRPRVQLVRRSCSGDSTAGEKRQARVRLARSASKWGPNRVVRARGETNERLTFTMNTDQLSMSNF